MKIKLTMGTIRIIPDNYPLDDAFIEHVLGLRKDGDWVALVRTVDKEVPTVPPSYLLETELPPTQSATEKAKEILAEGTNWETQNETPLPCPFCGAAPALFHKPEGPRDVCSKIACVNMHCPAQPEICDDRRVVEGEDPKARKAVIISLWNKRAKC